MKIKLLTSMVFDAICACSLIEEHEQYNKVAQNEVLEILKERTNGIFKDDTLSYSTLCGIIARYIPDPSTADLDDLYNLFVAIDEVDRTVRMKENNEFVQSFMYPNLDLLKNGFAVKYCNYIKALKQAGFEELWREKIQPVEQTQIDKLQTSYENTDIDGVLSLISKMKNTHIDDVTVYISLMSYPVSFTLGSSAFLNTIVDSDDYYKSGFLSMIAHELMHGFASMKLTGLYLDFMSSTRYLTSTHQALLADMHSGDEEEFVMAAEYYIMWRSGIMTKNQILSTGCQRYGGCVPLSLYIFEFMTQETKEIENYDRWLMEQFEKNAFQPQNIPAVIDSMFPKPDDYDNFFALFFTILRRCAYIIRDAQIHFMGDIKNDIETITGGRFLPNNNPTVQFANGQEEITEESAKRETLEIEGLTIDRITFAGKKEALALGFPYYGANVGPYKLDYEGDSFGRPYILNLAFHKDISLRAEFSFVCGNTRYLITSVCREGVVDIDTEEDPGATYRAHGEEIIVVVRRAERIVMLLNS